MSSQQIAYYVALAVVVVASGVGEYFHLVPNGTFYVLLVGAITHVVGIQLDFPPASNTSASSTVMPQGATTNTAATVAKIAIADQQTQYNLPAVSATRQPPTAG